MVDVEPLTLPDQPTPREAWEYLGDPRGLRNAAPHVNLRFKDDQPHIYVSVHVPRRKRDGEPSKAKRLIVGNPERTIDMAIISAALAVKHYMAVTFEGDLDG